MTITEYKGRTIVALVAGETNRTARETTGKNIWTTAEDFDLNEGICEALKLAGADFSKVVKIGWEI